MSPSFPEPTYSVSELCQEIRALLAGAFPALWLVGEAQRVRRSQRGHLYLELVEKGAGDEIAAKLDAVIWRGDFERIAKSLAAVSIRLDEGVEVRCRAEVDFYGPAGRLQLVIREVDATASLGALERRRQETLAALRAAGLLERNAGLPLSELPLSIGLVTSEGSAAYHDFLSTLAESGYGFRVLLVHAAVQGKGAEAEIASALSLLAARLLDAVVLIRGGGARSDLAVFDSREVALAVARMPVPVLTGLGHEIDQSIADAVAHTALKTPTKVAEHLVARVAAAEEGLGRLARALVRAGESLPRTAEVGARALGKRLEAAARGALRGGAVRLEALARLCRNLGPERTLARGFSITRTASGLLVRQPEAVAAGDELLTETMGGRIRSRVEVLS